MCGKGRHVLLTKALQQFWLTRATLLVEAVFSQQLRFLIGQAALSKHALCRWPRQHTHVGFRCSTPVAAPGMYHCTWCMRLPLIPVCLPKTIRESRQGKRLHLPGDSLTLCAGAAGWYRLQQRRYRSKDIKQAGKAGKVLFSWHDALPRVLWIYSVQCMSAYLDTSFTFLLLKRSGGTAQGNSTVGHSAHTCML